MLEYMIESCMVICLIFPKGAQQHICLYKSDFHLNPEFGVVQEFSLKIPVRLVSFQNLQMHIAWWPLEDQKTFTGLTLRNPNHV
jgi:hypothetical protein